MGYIQINGNFKFWENNATEGGVTDFNSIQRAVRRTLSDESLANKNLQALCNNARLDMFSPQRVSIPNEALHFRGFPKPTVSFNIQFFQIEANQGALDLRVTLNNKVGYNLNITVTCLIGEVDNSTYRKTISQTITEGNTQGLFIFEWGGTNIFTGNQPYIISYVTSGFPVYDPANLSGTVSATPIDNRPQFTVVESVNGFSCYDPADFSQTIGAIHYFAGALAVGTQVQNVTNNPISNGTYIQINGQFIYTISGGNGIISAFEFCEID